ncbi:MAG: alginate export family protein [Myxococcota bacterium]
MTVDARIFFAAAATVALSLCSLNAAAQDAPTSDRSEQAAEESGEVTAQETSEEEDPSVDWSFDATLRPRLETRFNNDFGVPDAQLNYGGAGNRDVFSQRALLGANASAGPVEARLAMIGAFAWGVTGGDDLTHPFVGLYEGWVEYTPVDSWYLQTGRFTLNYGDQRVLSPLGWSQAGRSWDGIRTGLTGDDMPVHLDLFATRYAEGLIDTAWADDGSALEGDSYLFGLYAELGEAVKPALSAADIYLLYDLQIDELGDDLPNRREIGLLGSRLKGEWDPVDLTVEGGFEFGSSCVVNVAGDQCTDDTIRRSAFFVDTELGATFDVGGQLRPFAGFSYQTGDDPDTADVDESYFQFYPLVHGYLGWMDIIGGRTNLQEFRLGVSYKAEDWSLVTKAHQFTRLQPDTESAGVETDIVGTWNATDVLKLQLGHGLFFPGDGVSTGEDPEGIANWTYFQMIATL